MAGNTDFWRIALDVSLNFCQNLLGGLSLDQADIALGYCFMRQNGFRAWTAIATIYTINSQSWPGRQAFKIATFLRLIKTFQAKRSFYLIHIDREICQC